ncbi:MAG: rhamnogalacturonan acetylesterase [Bacteroidales bacterium]|nr:rhamnogalacturonan acetylesterase [Bacteroidales bacterium]
MNNRFLLFPALLLSLFSCTHQINVDKPVDNIVIKAGFESMTGESVGSKTYVEGGSAIQWSSCAQDRVLYVFDSKGVKNVFTSEDTSESATRAFSGTVSEGSEVQWVLWSGKVAAEDQSAIVLESSTTDSFGAGYEPIGTGGSIQFQTKAGSAGRAVFAGSSLRVINPQNISSPNSFAQEANIAVMKPGDATLRNAMGYIRFTIPAGEGGHATIKSVTFSADENLAGEIQIDYSGDEPRTRIVADGSQFLTVNTRFNGSGYEAGTLFAVLPAGTYHHLTLTVTPFAGDAAAEDAATGEPYVLSSKNAVVVKRGQYTNAGIISPNAMRKPTLHLAGDSLCCEYSATSSRTGWGMCLAAALGGGDVTVVNRGASGASTKSFIDSGKWQTLINGVQAGDLVLVMFAHNDSSTDADRHTDPGSTYDQNLIKFINDIRGKSATPVLLTSVNSRMYNDAHTTLYQTTVSYANAMRSVAKTKSVALIDINQLTYQLFVSLGYDGTEPYFVPDNTHLTKLGAETVASMIAHGLKDLGLWKFDIPD